MENSSTGTLNYKVFENVDVDGVKLQKGTDIIFNIGALHYDSEQWINPEEFIPDRFNSESKYFKTPDGKQRNHASFLPFGIGPRNCPGAFISNL